MIRRITGKAWRRPYDRTAPRSGRLLGLVFSGFLASGLAVFPTASKAGCSEYAWLAQICWTVVDYCPKDYVIAAGQQLTTDAYPALSTLLGDSFGTTPKGTFKLPDLRGRSTVGTGDAPGLEAVKLGQALGETYLTLTLDRLAGHQHTFSIDDHIISGTLRANSSEGKEASPVDNFPGVASLTASPPYASSGPFVKMLPHETAIFAQLQGSGQTTPTGGAERIETLAPRLGLTPCIKVTGDEAPKAG